MFYQCYFAVQLIFFIYVAVISITVLSTPMTTGTIKTFNLQGPSSSKTSESHSWLISILPDVCSLYHKANGESMIKLYLSILSYTNMSGLLHSSLLNVSIGKSHKILRISVSMRFLRSRVVPFILLLQTPLWIILILILS